MAFQEIRNLEENSKTDEYIWSQIQLEEDSESEEMTTSPVNTNNNNNLREFKEMQRRMQAMQEENDRLKADEIARKEYQQTSRGASATNSIPGHSNLDPFGPSLVQINDWAADVDIGMSEYTEGESRNFNMRYNPFAVFGSETTNLNLQNPNISDCPQVTNQAIFQAHTTTPPKKGDKPYYA